MKLPILILGIIVVIIITFLTLNYFLPKNPQAEIKGHTFSLYIAKTTSEQEIGLAKYKTIGMSQGMLFLFAKSDYYSFWMKGMHFPIDIIFINGNKVIDIFPAVPIATNDALPTYTTKGKADKVLEINSGLTKNYKIKIGDRVNLSL